MELIKKRKFRIVVYAFIAYLALIGFCMDYSKDAPVRSDQRIFLTDYTTGADIGSHPYGNKNLNLTASGTEIIHAPVSLMTGQGFRIEFTGTVTGTPEADVCVDLNTADFDPEECQFGQKLTEGENEVSCDLYYENIDHPTASELRIFTNTEGSQLTVTNLKIERIESKRVGKKGYICLGIMVVFLSAAVILFTIDRKGDKN